MVAASGSTLSPTAPVFLPSQGPFSYAHAAGGDHWTRSNDGWKTKPFEKAGLSPSEQQELLSKRMWRPKTHFPTMPYRNSATHQSGPYDKYGHGSRTNASSPPQARRKPSQPKDWHQHKKQPVTHFGPKLLDTMSVHELEKAILQELGIDFLPMYDKRNGNRPSRSPQLINKYKTKMAIQKALRCQAPSLYWKVAKDIVRGEVSTSRPHTAQVIESHFECIENMAGMLRTRPNSEHNRRKAYAMVSISSDLGQPLGHTQYAPHDEQAEETITGTGATITPMTEVPPHPPHGAESEETRESTHSTPRTQLETALDRIRARERQLDAELQQAVQETLRTPEGTRSVPTTRQTPMPPGLSESHIGRMRLGSHEESEEDEEHSNDENKEDPTDESEQDASDSDSSDSSPSYDSLSLPSLVEYAPSAQDMARQGYNVDQISYARDLQRSARKLKNAEKKLRAIEKKNKKRKKRGTETIFRYLMKAVGSYDLPVLDYKPQPIRRRGSFLRFLDKLKLVTSSVSETKQMLSDPGNPTKPKSQTANRALFRVLCSRVDSYLVSQLHELQSRTGSEDGYQGLMLLRSLFADAKDDDYKNTVINQFLSVRLNPNESVFDFNKRFGYMYRSVVGSGQGVSEKNRLTYYLRALREHREPRILFKVKSYSESLRQGRPLILQDIQQRLIREEDQTAGTNKGLVFDQTVVARHGNRKPRSRGYANQSQATSQTNRSNKPPLKCWGCQGNHALRECRSTSEGDKRRIYEMYRPSNGGRYQQNYNKDSQHKSASQAQRKPKRGSRFGQLPTPNTTTKRKDKGTKVSFSNEATTEQREEPKQAHANATNKIKRKMAHCSMVKKVEDLGNSHKPLREGEIKDPFDFVPPPIDENGAHRNPNAKIVYYEDSVLLDSGASDCMTYTFKHLDMIRSAFANVCLADGTVHDCNYQGMMRISVTDIDTNKRTVVPMVDTLLVPGIRTVLWSVSALSSLGHEVRFGFSTVTIALNCNTARELQIRIRHPMLTHNGQQKIPFSFTGAVCAQRGEEGTDSDESSDQATDSENEINYEEFWDTDSDSGSIPSLDKQEIQESTDESNPSIVSDDESDEASERTKQVAKFLANMGKDENSKEKNLELPDLSPYRVDLLDAFKMVPYNQPPVVVAPATVYPDSLPEDFFRGCGTTRADKRASINSRLSSGELHRQYGTRTIQYVMMAERQLREEQEAQDEAERARRAQIESRPQVSLELMHRRMGHRSAKSLLLAEDAKLYSDCKIVSDHDDFCETCKISTIRSANCGRELDNQQVSGPGQVLFLDIQENLTRKTLVESHKVPYYLMICCRYSRFFKLEDMMDYSASQVIIALETFATDYPPFKGYTLLDNCHEIHVDAGSQLTSEEFGRWCVANKIRRVIAGVNHQEMNGLVERMWQACRKTAFAMCNNARLGWPFLHHALHYATHVMDMMPVKGCQVMKDNTWEQSCPHKMWYIEDKEAYVGLFRVFGCPCVAKVHRRRTLKDDVGDSSILTSKNIIQRGVRGIFIGFPKQQAGWSIYIPASSKILSSVDVAFDENFTSEGLAYNKLLFHDSLPVRGQGKGYLDQSKHFAFTGPPNFFEHSKVDTTDLEEEYIPHIYEDEVNFIDEFELAEISQGQALFERNRDRPDREVQGETREETEKRQEVAEEVARLLAQYDKEDAEESARQPEVEPLPMLLDGLTYSPCHHCKARYIP